MAMRKWALDFGSVFKVWQGGVVLIVVEDPVLARLVNTKNYARPRFLLPFAGEEAEYDAASLSLADGGKYSQALKQAWQSMFTSQSLKGYTQLMNDAAERLVDAVVAKSHAGEEVEIWRLFGNLTMEVVGSTAFGIELRAIKPGSKPIGTDLSAIHFEDADDDATILQKAAAVDYATLGGHGSPYLALIVLFPSMAPLIRRLAMRLPDAKLRKWLQARRLMRAMCFRTIAKVRRQQQQDQQNSQQPQQHSQQPQQQHLRQQPQSPPMTATASPGSGHASPAASDSGAAGASAAGGGRALRRKGGVLPPGGFVGHLLAADNPLLGRHFTDLEVAAQACHFLLAGFDTSSSALAFTVYHVARTPGVEEKVLAEVDRFGRDAVPTYDDLDQFPYLDAVFSEALRLTPPGAFGTIRVAREDFHLGSFRIRKGWLLNTAMYSFQTNPKYWADAGKFVPERFLAQQRDGGAAGHPAFAPWGDGQRACVGQRFARAQAKVTLIRLFQRFTLRLAPGQEPLELRTTITMAPKHGVRVTATPRS